MKFSNYLQHLKLPTVIMLSLYDAKFLAEENELTEACLGGYIFQTFYGQTNFPKQPIKITIKSFVNARSQEN